jgi:uncharacterized MAPEG superfamily protein
MTPTLTALCGFAGWTLILVFILANYRVSLTIRGERALNSFSADGTDLAGFGQRLTRAHLNCLEFLPVFGAVVLAAFASDRLSVTDPLAMVVLYARIGQSIVHIASVATAAVLVRATLFTAQLAIALYWIYGILSG